MFVPSVAGVRLPYTQVSNSHKRVTGFCSPAKIAKAKLPWKMGASPKLSIPAIEDCL